MLNQATGIFAYLMDQASIRAPEKVSKKNPTEDFAVIWRAIMNLREDLEQVAANFNELGLNLLFPGDEICDISGRVVAVGEKSLKIGTKGIIVEVKQTEPPKDVKYYDLIKIRRALKEETRIIPVTAIELIESEPVGEQKEAEVL